MRTYGTLAYDPVGKRWAVACEAHVAIVLKRLFVRAQPGQRGAILLTDTSTNARELQWFLSRYPLKMDDVARRHLVVRAGEHRQQAAAVEQILSGKYQAALPFELALPPRPYQRQAAELALRTGRLLLADDVGLGKTASAITTFCDPRTLPALVVTLTHLPKQWAREIGRFAPNLRVHLVKRGQPYDLQKGGALPDVVIMNYAKLAGWADALAPIVKSVVFDEAQELRRPDSNKYVAAKQLADAAAFRLGLTATPIYNLGSEFHAVLDVIAPDALGSRDEFLREWCKNVRHDNSGQAKAEIAEPKVFGMFLRDMGIMLRRTRAEVGRELPPLQKIEHCIDANLAELNRLDRSTAELAQILLRQGGAGFAKMQAARDLDVMLRRATGLAKAPFVAEFVRMLLESEQKVVLYGWHHAVYDVWRDALKDFSPVFFTGEESPAEKERSRLAFVEGDARVLVMSLRAGAGLDGLQHVCRTVVFGELDWSPGVHEQAIGRVFRDEQRDPVAAYFLHCDDGADPIILDVLFRKKQQIEGVRDPNAELVEALAVDPERVKKLAAAYLKRHGIAVPAAAA